LSDVSVPFVPGRGPTIAKAKNRSASGACHIWTATACHTGARATGLAMKIRNTSANWPLRLAARMRSIHIDWRGALASFSFLALTGCGTSDGAGALFVDPGRYTLYHCDDLATRRKALIARENELRGLIERAGESPGGAVVGSFAYRSDYDAVLAEEKLLARNAAEKNCSFASPLQSDQTIR